MVVWWKRKENKCAQTIYNESVFPLVLPLYVGAMWHCSLNQCESVIREQWPLGQWRMLDNLIGKNATTTTPLIYSRARFSQISGRMCATAFPAIMAAPPSLSAKQHSAGGVWRQQILNSIQRKSKLGREEIQPVTISVSMAFRGLAPPWKRISRCT